MTEAPPWGSVADILVAVDFSPCSRRAFDAARHLSADIGARLVVVHAFEQTASGFGVEDHLDPINRLYAEGQRDDAMRLTENWLEPARAAGLQVDILAREGRAKSVVLDVLEEVAPTFVVLGHHGRGVRLGSVAKAVLDKARCPVMVVPAVD